MGIIDWVKRINRTGSDRSKRKDPGLIKDSRPVIANYNESIKRGLRRAGISREKDFEVLEWIIGKDFFDLSIHLWPERIYKRHGKMVLLSNNITQTVYEFAMMWCKTHNK